jgi:ketosteroid isomerase-like protein
MYHRLVRRRILTSWEALSNHEIDGLPLADDVRFTFAGDHGLAIDAHSAAEEREWLRALFVRFPRVRFEVDDVVIGGPPWAMRVATRYRAVQDGETLYRGAHFARMRGGRIVEEVVLPDTQAIARIAP